MKYALSNEANNWEKLNGKSFFSSPNPGDAGYDIRSIQSVLFFVGEQKRISTGLFLELPDNCVGFIKDRSSLVLRRLYVQGGVIDSSYRGELVVVLENRANQNYHIEPGERIAQLVLVRMETPELMKVEKSELSETRRGSEGFGSTGK